MERSQKHKHLKKSFCPQPDDVPIRGTFSMNQEKLTNNKSVKGQRLLRRMSKDKKESEKVLSKGLSMELPRKLSKG